MYENKENISRYADIINLPHHVSKKHPQMPTSDRAAQFSPFAALTGYDEAVKETAQHTESRVELSDDQKAIINDKIVKVKDNIARRIVIEITYFVADERKQGGFYITVKGTAEKVDEFKRIIFLEGEVSIPIDDILDISCDEILI